MKRSALIIGVAFLFLIGTSTSLFAYSFDTESFTNFSNDDGIIPYDYGRPDEATAADPLTDFQGQYLGTVYDANDDEAIIIEFLAWASIPTEGLSIYGKTDENTLWMSETQEKPESTDADGAFISGTWETYNGDPPLDADVIDLIIVKGGNDFSVHLYDPAVSNGEWNVGYLPGNFRGDYDSSAFPPSVSHVSAYYNGGTPVPEPATMLLLGTGLVGLAGFGRKKLFNR